MVNDPASRRRERVRKIAQAYRDSQEIMSICVSLGICVGGGYWLDLKFGWKPVFTICGVFLGLVTAGLSLRRLVRRMDGRQKRRASEGRDRGQSEEI